MNKAIFEFSLDRLRIRNWKDALSLVLFYSFVPALMALTISVSSGFESPASTATRFFAIFESPLFQMFLVFCFVSEAPVSMRAVGDSDPMCLIFSRPISRLNYVLTKWLSGSLGALLVIIPAAFIFQIVVSLMQIDVAFVTGYSLAAIVLNTLVHGALIVMLHSFPAPAGLALWVMSHFVVSFGETFGRVPLSQAPWWARPIVSTFVFLADWLYDFVHLEIDVYSLLNSVNFSWLPVLTYVSNLVLLLWLAAWVLSKREFFYGTD